MANSNDLAYALGFYTIDNPPIDKGTFVDVWKKQADGSWKAIVDTFNSDMPAPRLPANHLLLWRVGVSKRKRR